MTSGDEHPPPSAEKRPPAAAPDPTQSNLGGRWRLKSGVAVITAVGGLIGAVTALIASVGSLGFAGGDDSPPAASTAATPTTRKTYELSGRSRVAFDFSRALRMAVPREWVSPSSGKFDFNASKKPTGPALTAYPPGTYDANDAWSDPFLYVGASRVSAKELRIATLDDRAVLRVFREFSHRFIDWSSQCQLQAAGPFAARGMKGYMTRWTSCGPRTTGRLWQVVAYPADRSVVVIFQYFRPFVDHALESAGATALGSFRVDSRRVRP